MALRLSSLRHKQRQIRQEQATRAERPVPERRTPDGPPRGFARLLRDPRVQRGAAILAIGATGVSIPLLAHHPGAPRPERLVPRPPASAEPFPEVSPPLGQVPPPTVPPPAAAPHTAPPPTAPAPRELPPLDGPFSMLTNVDRRPGAPFPGIRTLDVRADGQRIHVADVDLTRDEYRVRTTTSEERRQTVSSFAETTGALVAINGDWFSYETYGTHGLAVGEGQTWPGAQDLAEWLFLACTRENECTIDREGQARPIDPAWDAVVGGNGAALVVDGAVWLHEGDFYAADRHPRSAVGLTADGRMIFVAVEGRQGDARGMTFNEVGQLMKELGAVQAMMLDGGGSTTLVVGGQRVNELPDGAGERVVANHLAIVPAG